MRSYKKKRHVRDGSVQHFKIGGARNTKKNRFSNKKGGGHTSPPLNELLRAIVNMRRQQEGHSHGLQQHQQMPTITRKLDDDGRVSFVITTRPNMGSGCSASHQPHFGPRRMILPMLDRRPTLYPQMGQMRHELQSPVEPLSPAKPKRKRSRKGPRRGSKKGPKKGSRKARK